jgi:hypothetical protein
MWIWATNLKIDIKSLPEREIDNFPNPGSPKGK